MGISIIDSVFHDPSDSESEAEAFEVSIRVTPKTKLERTVSSSLDTTFKTPQIHRIKNPSLRVNDADKRMDMSSPVQANRDSIMSSPMQRYTTATPIRSYPYPSPIQHENENEYPQQKPRPHPSSDLHDDVPTLSRDLSYFSISKSRSSRPFAKRDRQRSSPSDSERAGQSYSISPQPLGLRRMRTNSSISMDIACSPSPGVTHLPHTDTIPSSESYSYAHDPVLKTPVESTFSVALSNTPQRDTILASPFHGLPQTFGMTPRSKGSPACLFRETAFGMTMSPGVQARSQTTDSPMTHTTSLSTDWIATHTSALEAGEETSHPTENLWLRHSSQSRNSKVILASKENMVHGAGVVAAGRPSPCPLASPPAESPPLHPRSDGQEDEVAAKKRKILPYDPHSPFTVGTPSKSPDSIPLQSIDRDHKSFSSVRAAPTSATRLILFRNATSPDPYRRPLTPAFELERPSPAAFLSQGLLRKSTSSAPGSGTKESVSSRSSSRRMPDTPIKVSTRPLLSRLKTEPTSTLRFESTDVVASLPSLETPISSRGGLRRKSSAVWTHPAASGNLIGRTPSSKKTSDNLSGHPNPVTPARPFPASLAGSTIAVTPSPPAIRRNYPFSRGDQMPAESEPLKKKPLFSRLQNSHQRALSRISTPLLSAAAKLGSSPQRRRSVSSQSSSRFEREFIDLREIGHGEFSTVWKVKNRFTDEVSAIKRCKKYLGLRDRARQMEEVNTLKQLSPHPYILNFKDAWEETGQIYIQTQLIDCGDLATFLHSISDQGGLDEARCWKVLSEMTSALRYIHSQGILHLDFKPANMLIKEDGSLVVGDFGLSSRRSLTALVHPGDRHNDAINHGIIEGDRDYLAPEVLRGATGSPADVFSLGISMLEIVANIILPSNGDAWHKLRSNDFSDLEESETQSSIPRAALSGSFENPLHVSHQLWDCIRGLMRSAPEERWSLDRVWVLGPIRRLRTANPKLELIGPPADNESQNLRSFGQYSDEEEDIISASSFTKSHQFAAAIAALPSPPRTSAELGSSRSSLDDWLAQVVEEIPKSDSLLGKSHGTGSMAIGHKTETEPGGDLLNAEVGSVQPALVPEVEGFLSALLA